MDSIVKKTKHGDLWDRYWEKKANTRKVYSNEGRISDNIGRMTAVSGMTALEVGAGTGRDSVDLAKKGATVVVLDKSFKAMEIIRNVMGGEGVDLQLVIGDVVSLPFTSNCFQLVFHQGLLEHFYNPLSILRENYRVLRKGGYILVDVPQRYHPYTVVKHALMMLDRWFAGWETEYTIGSLSTIITDAGFDNIVHKYGVWMNPSFFYRSLREVLLGFGIELPMYPAAPHTLRKIRAFLRDRAAKSRMSFYTYHTIGIIAKK
ncbi:MAG: class I SAM-dependent methyltransferase [Candidatus Glassbacteria bacterium]